MNEINKFAKPDCLKFLIGNKADLINESQIKYNEARLLASQINATYFHVSAKNNENIDEFFEAATNIFLSKFSNFFDAEENKKVTIKRKETKDKGKRKRAKKQDENC